MAQSDVGFIAEQSILFCFLRTLNKLINFEISHIQSFDQKGSLGCLFLTRAKVVEIQKGDTLEFVFGLANVEAPEFEKLSVDQ